MEALLNVEAVDSQGNTAALRALYDKVEIHTRELQTLGVAAEAYNCLLPSVLMKKLPKELCLLISRQISEDEWNLERIMKELSDELKARERTAIDRKRLNEDHMKGFNYTKSHNFKRTNEQPTSATLYVCTSNHNCCYCQGNHESEACRKVVKIESRKQIIRDSGRCFICLKKGHLSRVCRSNDRCSHCHGKHHSSICYGNENDSSTKESAQEASGLNPQAPPFKATSLLTDTGGTILLQTAKAPVVNPDDNRKRTELRLIFDSGSQQLYISERAKGKLALRVLGKRDMKIMTFGAKEANGHFYEIVRVSVQTRDHKNITMRLLTIPIICESIKGVSTCQYVQQCEHLQALSLADEVKGGQDDILVGLDYYWQFVTGKVIMDQLQSTQV